MTRPDYGIDAPGVILKLGLSGLVLLVSGIVLPHAVPALRVAVGLAYWGAAWIVSALLMVAYAKWGKLRHRDRILAIADLRDEQTVLDVGTGRGLLAIGAARALPRGRAIGIDIFQAADLSGNALESTLANVQLEGVGDRVEIRVADARALDLPDGSIDRVVSNLCLHNLPTAKDRDAAIDEIVRVLKPGGRAIISDFKNSGAYAAAFRRHGYNVQRRGPFLLDTFPPLTIVVATQR